PASWDSIIINRKVWDSLTPREPQAMTEACYANITYNWFDQMNAPIQAIEKIEQAGVQVRRFRYPVIQARWKASQEVMQEEAAKDPLFKEAYESLTAYLKRVGRWGELQALPRFN